MGANIMAESELAIVILAAGKGTRLRSRRAKVLHRAGGRALVEHVVRAARELGAPVFVVVGHQGEEVAKLVEPVGARTILQEPQGGTGHALQVTRGALENFRRAIVVPGDAPLVRAETLAALARTHQAAGAAATVLTAVLDDPSGYGRILREPDGAVRAIVEQKAASETELAIREINSGMYCFELGTLWSLIGDLRPENVHRELYLTDVVALLNLRGERVAAQRAEDPKEILGCNTRRELADVDRVFRRRKVDALMAAGVTFYLPETALLDPDVEIGADTVIEPCVELLGATRIGAGVTVSTGCVIADSVIEDDAFIRPHSLVVASRLGRGVVVGPFAHLRDGAEVAAGARVGNYVEMKKSRLGEGSKAMHLTYLGDAKIGRDTNIGAGTITCNYDGVRKNPTTIGSRVFIGSGTELVAPVEVGDGAYVAAGSTVTESVPPDSLAIARAQQVTKRDWARARRAKLAGAKPAAVKPPKKAKKRASTRRGAKGKGTSGLAVKGRGRKGSRGKSRRPRR
jgi:bifunctional UDP-N-acetylglucosamine pyrophosphorylase/glucosamine-1-phosphate N-acetyltransferase